MKLILITPEEQLPYEIETLNLLLEGGLELLHIRKPFLSVEEMKRYLSRICPKYADRLVLHDHFELGCLFNIKRFHLNNRNPLPPLQAQIRISKSCHSLEEVKEIDRYEYVFLSPVFDSISKVGYACRFTEEVLTNAYKQGILTHKVIALGGIAKENVDKIAGWGFGGVALIGSVWGNFAITQETNSVTRRFSEIKTICDKL